MTSSRSALGTQEVSSCLFDMQEMQPMTPGCLAGSLPWAVPISIDLINPSQHGCFKNRMQVLVSIFSAVGDCSCQLHIPSPFRQCRKRNDKLHGGVGSAFLQNFNWEANSKPCPQAQSCLQAWPKRCCLTEHGPARSTLCVLWVLVAWGLLRPPWSRLLSWSTAKSIFRRKKRIGLSVLLPG